LRKPTQPFDTLQGHTTTFFSNFEIQEHKFSQVFARFRFIYFFVSCFLFLFFLFLLIYLFWHFVKTFDDFWIAKTRTRNGDLGLCLFFYLVCLHFCFLFIFFFFTYFFNFILFYLSFTSFRTLQENDLTFPALYKNTNSNISGTLQEVMNINEFNRI